MVNKSISTVMIIAAFAVSAMSQIPADLRNVETGDLIYKNSYIDQPYVLKLNDGSWLCVFTTGAESESRPGQHIVAIKSFDKGKTWNEPVKIEPNEGPISSWAIPYQTSYGRIYVFYNYNGDNISIVRGKPIKQAGLLGWYCYKYSDDSGKTWSKERYRIPIRKTAADIFNDFDGFVQMFWGIDKPHFCQGSVYFAFSKLGKFPQEMGEGWMLASNNLDSERNPQKINWEMLPGGEYGIRNPKFGSVQEEHNTVILNDGTFYCIFRTALGFLGYTVSRNKGISWTMPDTLRYTCAPPNIIKNPRACPRLFKCSNGNYLLWYHNHGGIDFKNRTPVWVSGGVEKNGTIEWSQPEILLYTHETNVNGMSYPDLIEENGKYWITETQKHIARTHVIDPLLLEGLWKQQTANSLIKKGLIFSKNNITKKTSFDIPGSSFLKGNGITIEMLLNCKNLKPGQIILDTKANTNKGIQITTATETTLKIEVSDGENAPYIWTCDNNILQANKNHYVSFVLDKAARIISVIVDGRLCDGGYQRQYGWSKFPNTINEIKGVNKCNILTSSDAVIKQLSIYDRYLTTSECISNYRYFGNVFPAVRYPVIPKPVTLEEKEGEFIINKKTSICVANPSSESKKAINSLQQAIKELTGYNLQEKKNIAKENCILFIEDASIKQKEGYKLSVSDKKIEIRFSSWQGAFYAIQTIRQLFPSISMQAIKIPAVEITDYPALPYRGYLIDVARHFFPFEHLMKTVDMLAYYKLNIFHIHLTDDQGWRFESKKHPRLHEVGGWRSETQNGHRTDTPLTFDGTPHGGYYTQEDLKKLVKYAQDRYIEIIPEIDIPGHSHALLAAYPQYGCVKDTTYTVSGVWGYDDNILCPTEETFTFLESVFDELMTVFPGKYIHIGGDEVQKRRWKESAFCQDLIKKLNLKDEKGLQSYFIQRMEKYLNNKGRQIIGWDETLEGGIAPNATIMSWRDEIGGIEAAKSKHNVIMTPRAFMYVNFYNTPLTNQVEPLANTHVVPLRKVYDYTPFPKSLTNEEQQYIIGLQASLWAEYCKTVENAEHLTYPRLCAMSEGAWTPVARKNYDDFYNRLSANILHLDRWNIDYSKLFIQYK